MASTWKILSTHCDDCGFQNKPVWADETVDPGTGKTCSQIRREFMEAVAEEHHRKTGHSCGVLIDDPRAMHQARLLEAEELWKHHERRYLRQRKGQKSPEALRLEFRAHIITQLTYADTDILRAVCEEM